MPIPTPRLLKKEHQEEQSMYGTREKWILIACEIFFREIAFFASSCEKIVHPIFLPKGLHDRGGEAMREYIQKEIDRCDKEECEKILLGYGLCNNGIAGIQARSHPLIVPKVHDCISLFLGSKERYQDYFFQNTGTYFHTTGWIERRSPGNEFFDNQLGPQQDMESLIQKYGEENAHYIAQTLNPLQHYHKIGFISLAIPGIPDYQIYSQRIAKDHNLEWEKIEGDPSFLKRLVDGPYQSEEFLTVAPGEIIAATGDERILSSHLPLE